MPNLIKNTEFDCIVIGGGHAGAEAAHAAAKIGVNTCLMTISKDTIAKMSCNPAIGGLAKGQIAREVDALGRPDGTRDRRNRNTVPHAQSLERPRRAGPAAQTDKYKYKDFIRAMLEQTPNLTIVETMATEIITENNIVRAVKCSNGITYNAPTVILTAGTFLRGMMHIGTHQFPGGRLDEPASNELSDSLMKIGLELGRLKTGTPARLDGCNNRLR